MPKSTKRTSRGGRKPLALYGLQKRDKKVLASFTPIEYEQLEEAADQEGVTVSELVAQRATMVL